MGAPGKLTRRAVLAGLGATLLPPPGKAASFLPPDRTLWLYNANTGDAGKATYVVDGQYDPGALASLDWFMRDWRLGRWRVMDRRIYDALFVIQQKFRVSAPLVVTSGYRTPETNERLRERIPGVAKNSLHIEGLAVDFWVPERRLEDVWGFLHAWDFGGLGKYRSFIHCDVGLPGRRWES